MGLGSSSERLRVYNLRGEYKTFNRRLGRDLVGPPNRGEFAAFKQLRDTLVALRHSGPLNRSTAPGAHPLEANVWIAPLHLVPGDENIASMNKGGPTKEDFDKLLLWLDSDRDAAGRKYERIRYKLIKIFSCRGCCEAEDLADKCVDRVTSKIDWLMQNYEGNPALYFYAVAKKIYLEHIKPKKLPDPSPPNPDSDELEQVCGYLEDCLRKLPAADSDLALRYHQGEKQEKIRNRKALANELKISRNALRIKVWHIHASLKECVKAAIAAGSNA